MNKLAVILMFVLVVALGVYVATKDRNNQAPLNVDPTQDEKTEPMSPDFENPKKSAHYESNTPEHGSVLAAPPINIVINFNFDLAAPSSISVTKDGKDYATGDLQIDSNKLSMRRGFDAAAPDGTYKVTYNACWPDRSCHDGHFMFAIDRSLSSSYEDMTGKGEVVVRMSEIMFQPKNIKISKGSKVTWINDEDIEHYVNTDSHPAHTYHPNQNSSALGKGESYSTTFQTPGLYPYHCSAHADVMTANILVI